MAATRKDLVTTLDVGLRPEITVTEYPVPALNGSAAYTQIYRDMSGLKFIVEGRQFGNTEKPSDEVEAIMRTRRESAEPTRQILRFSDAMMTEFTRRNMSLEIAVHGEGYNINFYQPPEKENTPGYRDLGNVNVLGELGGYEFSGNNLHFQFGDNGPIVPVSFMGRFGGPMPLAEAGKWADLNAQIESLAKRSERALPEGRRFSPRASYANYAEPKAVDVGMFSTTVLDLDKAQSTVNVAFGDPKTGNPMDKPAYIRTGDRIGLLTTRGTANAGVTIDLAGAEALELNHTGDTRLIYDSMREIPISGANKPTAVVLSNQFLFNEAGLGSSWNLSEGSYKDAKLQLSVSGNDVVIRVSRRPNEDPEEMRIPGIAIKDIVIGEPGIRVPIDRLKSGTVELNAFGALSDPAAEARKAGLTMERASIELPLKTPITFAEVDRIDPPQPGHEAKSAFRQV